MKLNELCNEAHPTAHQFRNLSTQEIYKKGEENLLVFLPTKGQNSKVYY